MGKRVSSNAFLLMAMLMLLLQLLFLLVSNKPVEALSQFGGDDDEENADPNQVG